MCWYLCCVGVSEAWLSDPSLLLPTPEITLSTQVPDPLKNQELILWMRTVLSGKIIPLARQGKPRDQTEPFEEITVTLFSIIAHNNSSQLPVDHETIYWALPTEAGWGLWLFLICFLENHLLQFLIFIWALESLTSGSCCSSCPSCQPLYTSRLSQSAQTTSLDFLLWWGYSSTTQKFLERLMSPTAVPDISALLSRAAFYPILFPGVHSSTNNFTPWGLSVKVLLAPVRWLVLL